MSKPKAAHDPRIPAEFEPLSTQIAAVLGFHPVDWYVDGKVIASTMNSLLLALAALHAKRGAGITLD